eukprot:14273122-Alexandrium_andersonii.AAC.1
MARFLHPEQPGPSLPLESRDQIIELEVCSSHDPDSESEEADAQSPSRSASSSGGLGSSPNPSESMLPGSLMSCSRGLEVSVLAETAAES